MRSMEGEIEACKYLIDDNQQVQLLLRFIFNSFIRFLMDGQQEIVPIHPELKEALEPILGTTYGLIVYQEQVMKIATDLAGFTMGKADALRKVMGKKKMDILATMYVEFEAGMVANGFSKDSVKTLWDVVVPFAKYAFNKVFIRPKSYRSKLRRSKFCRSKHCIQKAKFKHKMCRRKRRRKHKQCAAPQS